MSRHTGDNGSRHEFSPPSQPPSTALDLEPGKLLAAAALLSCLSDLAVAMLQEEHAEKDAIGVVLDLATKEYLRMPLSRPVGPSQQVQLTGQGSWRTGKFKSCDDVAAASSSQPPHETHYLLILRANTPLGVLIANAACCCDIVATFELTGPPTALPRQLHLL